LSTKFQLTIPVFLFLFMITGALKTFIEYIESGIADTIIYSNVESEMQSSFKFISLINSYLSPTMRNE